MSQELIERIQKARALRVQADGFVFHARRPSDAEAAALAGASLEPLAFVRRFVTGWEGVRERDVVADGGDAAAPFSPELWQEWIADRPEFWAPLSSAIIGAYTAHAQRLADLGNG